MANCLQLHEFWEGYMVIDLIIIASQVRDEFSDFRESTIAAFLTQSVKLDENSTIKFEIWDTAGQERYKSLAPIYFRNSNAAVIVYDITQPPETSFEKAKQWVKELKRSADPSIVIMLVGNKIDMASQRKTPRELGQQFAGEEGLLFTEASAKTGEEVEELFHAIAKKLPLAPPQQRSQSSSKGVNVSGQEATPQACTC
ncbi:hypothetical protein B9479_003294 [Cryptococcus floricola]|uniref:GTP-binding protein ypt5 n=1 Tax=Cryptococcus floricola TaxID=2591691 RepID=A0A5D3B0J3_9TREE|nr:hypothetical protein B9479_003294 [Cryptococcus floricola]